MSFSQNIKEEILSVKFNKKCCFEVQKDAELLTENENIDISELRKRVKTNKCCQKAFLRGAFLGSGCIVDPNTDYHFEITSKTKKNANIILDIMNNIIGFEAKLLKRSSNLYVIYIKDSEQISMMLSYLGASKALLDYENIRVERSIKNNINRNINCETANIAKTITASYKQIAAIDKLEQNGMIDKLSYELKEICLLRKKHPELSLGELCKLCKEPVTKSGINHRLSKIIKMAENM